MDNSVSFSSFVVICEHVSYKNMSEMEDSKLAFKRFFFFRAIFSRMHTNNLIC